MVPLMTIALVCYFFAFYLARKFPQQRWKHIAVACFAFVNDATATYLMYLSHVHVTNWFIAVHLGFSISALLLFFVQATLGILHKRKLHIMFAKYIFLPVWVLAFASGFLFLI